jgi:hypothetical protein
MMHGASAPGLYDRAMKPLIAEITRVMKRVPTAHAHYLESWTSSMEQACAMIEMMEAGSDPAKAMMIKMQTQAMLQAACNLLQYFGANPTDEGARAGPRTDGLADARTSLLQMLELTRYSEAFPHLVMMDTSGRARDWVRHIEQNVIDGAHRTPVEARTRAELLAMPAEDLGSILARITRAYACLYASHMDM